MKKIVSMMIAVLVAGTMCAGVETYYETGLDPKKDRASLFSNLTPEQKAFFKTQSSLLRKKYHSTPNQVKKNKLREKFNLLKEQVKFYEDFRECLQCHLAFMPSRNLTGNICHRCVKKHRDDVVQTKKIQVPGRRLFRRNSNYFRSKHVRFDLTKNTIRELSPNKMHYAINTGRKPEKTPSTGPQRNRRANRYAALRKVEEDKRKDRDEKRQTSRLTMGLQEIKHERERIENMKIIDDLVNALDMEEVQDLDKAFTE